MKTFIPKIVVLLLVFSAVLLPARAWSEEIIEYTDKGAINWSKRFIHATGTGYPPKDVPGSKTILSNKNIQMEAEKEAISNLLDTILKIRITASLTVGDFVSADINHFSQLEEMVMNAKTIRKDYITDGTVNTTKQLPMDGGFLQLILPPELRQFEPVKTLTQDTKEESPLTPKDQTFSGIIIDATGIGFKPVIVPSIISENGKPVYSPVFIGRGSAVQKGICYYSDSIEDKAGRKRTGENPLIIKGLKAAPHDASTIIISSRDASKVLNDSENLTLLNQCKVTVVTEPLSGK